MFDFVVRKRGAAAGTPVDKIMPAIDESAFIERYEHVAHRARKSFVHRKALAIPIGTVAELPLLFDDRRMVIVFYRPRALEKFFAAYVVPRCAFFFKRALDDVLRRDTRVIGARHPQRVVAFHAVIAHDDVLQRIVETVSDVQNTRHVRRRNDD